MNVVEIRMLKWISENMRKDRIYNEEIHLKIKIVPIDKKIKDCHLRLFDQVKMITINKPLRKSDSI